MNQKHYCEYIITKDENVYTLQTKNNISLQIINEYKFKLNNLSIQLTYNSDTKLLQLSIMTTDDDKTSFNIDIDIVISKPENNNILFYQYSSDITRNDDTISCFSADSGSIVDIITVLTYLDNSSTGNSIQITLGGLDQSKNIVDMSQCIVNINLRCIPYCLNKVV